MRNRLFGAIGVLWGAFILVSGYVRGLMRLRVRGSVTGTATIAAVPAVAGAVSETAAVVTALAFWTNTRQPWSLTVTNGIA
jgi:hypothetical protein